MRTNALVGDIAAVVATVDPVSHATTATVTSGWVDMGAFQQILALALAGVIGPASSLDAKLEQAQDSSGTGAKDVTGKAITQLAGTDDNKQAQINLRVSELDIDNGFSFARLSMTATVNATEQVDAAGVVAGLSPAYSPIDTTALGIVEEIVA